MSLDLSASSVITNPCNDTELLWIDLVPADAALDPLPPEADGIFSLAWVQDLPVWSDRGSEYSPVWIADGMHLDEVVERCRRALMTDGYLPIEDALHGAYVKLAPLTVSGKPILFAIM